MSNDTVGDQLAASAPDALETDAGHVYHVVCHDCPFEDVHVRGDYARATCARHRDTHAHAVEIAEVSD